MREHLESKLLAYADSDAYAFHMPGHKRVMNPFCADADAGNTAGYCAETVNSADGCVDAGGAAQPTGIDILKADITEIDGFDNLHDAEGILRDEMEAAAEMYGAKETLFSVNGSTCALLAAVSAAVPRGGTILIERACHMAVYHAAYLRELDILYIEDLGVKAGAPGVGQTEDDADNAADPEGGQTEHFPQLDAVIITSPTYEGCMKNVAGWARFAHEHGGVLIVDEAHGAHLGFHPYFPESATRCGADIVVQSTHKTLPAMTQTALLHNVSGWIPGRRLRFFMDIYETSSPSYVLMASITGALRMVREQGDELFGKYAERLKRVRRELCALRHFGLAGGVDAVLTQTGELPSYAAGTRMDPGKLVLVPAGQNANAKQHGADWLYGILRDEYHLQMEMRTESYCLAMTSFADTDEGFGRLVSAMREIDERVEREQALATFAAEPERKSVAGAYAAKSEQASEIPDVKSEQEAAAESFAQKSRILRVPVVRGSVAPMKISDALDAECEMVALQDAAESVCADFVILYPPDVPLIVPGEIYTVEKAAEIAEWIEKGFSVIGVDMRVG